MVVPGRVQRVMRVVAVTAPVCAVVVVLGAGGHNLAHLAAHPVHIRPLLNKWL